MDVEKTMEFILDQQAKNEVLWQRNEESWRRNEERWKRNEESWKRADARMDKFERSLVGIRKLLLMGAKTMVRSQKDIRELAAAQKRTDQKFERLVELLSRRSPNGRR